MAKGIKELTALEAVNPGLLFEAVGAVADSEGIYARKAEFSALESFMADKSRGDGAPVVKLAGDAEAAAKAYADAAVAGGKNADYFTGLPDELKNGINTSAVNAVAKEYARAKGREAELQQAVDGERGERVAREGAGPIPVIETAAPGSFVEAFGDVVTRFKKTENRDDEQTAWINDLRKDYEGENGDAGFKKTVNDKIGDMADLPHSEDSLAKNIAGVFETANRPLVAGDEFAGKGTAAEPLNLADLAVATDKIADGAVATGKIADEAVTAGKLADGAVATGKIEDGAVTAGKLADGAVATGKIEDLAVTAEKLDSGLLDKINGVAGLTWSDYFTPVNENIQVQSGAAMYRSGGEARLRLPFLNTANVFTSNAAVFNPVGGKIKTPNRGTFYGSLYTASGGLAGVCWVQEVDNVLMVAPLPGTTIAVSTGLVLDIRFPL